MPNAAMLVALLAAADAETAQPAYRAVTQVVPQVAAQSFGSDSQYKTIPASDFEPDLNGMGFYRSENGYRGLAAAPGDPPWRFGAPFELPNGALIEEICFFLYDISDTDDIRVVLSRSEVDVGSSPDVEVAASMPATSAGYFAECFEFLPLSLPRYRTFANLDGDILSGWLFWELRVELNDRIEHEFRGAYVKYRLDVSPSPASPTFSDVGPSSLLRYVEAMNAAGIATGCTADRFCPNDPVTRVQLAVMLSRALGLHWPF